MQTNRIIPCKTSNKKTQETETHIFLECPRIIPTKPMLKEIMQKETKNPNIILDIDMAITLHNLPNAFTYNRYEELELIGENKLHIIMEHTKPNNT